MINTLLAGNYEITQSLNSQLVTYMEKQHIFSTQNVSEYNYSLFAYLQLVPQQCKEHNLQN